MLSPKGKQKGKEPDGASELTWSMEVGYVMGLKIMLVADLPSVIVQYIAASDIAIIELNCNKKYFLRALC